MLSKTLTSRQLLLYLPRALHISRTKVFNHQFLSRSLNSSTQMTTKSFQKPMPNQNLVILGFEPPQSCDLIEPVILATS